MNAISVIYDNLCEELIEVQYLILGGASQNKTSQLECFIRQSYIILFTFLWQPRT